MTGCGKNLVSLALIIGLFSSVGAGAEEQQPNNPCGIDTSNAALKKGIRDKVETVVEHTLLKCDAPFSKECPSPELSTLPADKLNQCAKGSTNSGFTIRNTHFIAEGQGCISRGQTPIGMEQYQELVRNKVTDVLLFKTQDANEVDSEIKMLVASGYSCNQIHFVAMPWATIGSFKEACTYTIQGLKLMKEAYDTAGANLYLHCTLGEDRTGYLAALYRLAAEGWSIDQAFYQEMCDRGYEDGAQFKPGKVTKGLRKVLTPVYTKMAYLINKGKITMDNLDESVCAQDPENDPDFQNLPGYDASRYQCQRKINIPAIWDPAREKTQNPQ